jgi:hypothetical protein
MKLVILFAGIYAWAFVILVVVMSAVVTGLWALSHLLLFLPETTVWIVVISSAIIAGVIAMASVRDERKD